ncbi:hypothetical protein NQ318_006094 [Aromia moschata]|uniref:Cilia- and flagella-associated protein 299 n=1 Tax=Aromia moschata TaxID=1265417 RepID=A0AAV8Z4C8_9CUCU|nr:hypothetical protein NQ318_006094 [Aromia moschata]
MSKKLIGRTSLLEADRRLLQYTCYEDYLDSLGTAQDECYLASEETSRAIAELGYRSSGETLSREEFEKRLAAILLYLYPPYKPYELHSEGFSKGDQLQLELSLRERANRLGNLSTIIFLKIYTKSGFEISGYIDYAEKLITEDWKPFFRGKKKIVPKFNDLGYYHYRAGKITANDTLNYKVLYEDREGLLFQNRFDRKTINLAPGTQPGANTTKKRVHSADYDLVVLFDHVVRQKI